MERLMEFSRIEASPQLVFCLLAEAVGRMASENPYLY